LARALLQLEGFEVVGEAADALSALDAARRLQPSVVVLDVQLPDLDGFESPAVWPGVGTRERSCSSPAATARPIVGGLPRAKHGPPVADLQRQLQAARAALTEFARGVHPRTLTEAGLAAALPPSLPA
jgi:hypothetical protein